MSRIAIDDVERGAQDSDWDPVKEAAKKLATRQAIQWMIADSEVELEAARWLVLRAAWAVDQGWDPRHSSSMAKLYTSEVAVRCANEGVQIHGGYGFIKDYPAEKYYRDAKLCTIGEGTSEIQKIVISRIIMEEALSV